MKYLAPLASLAASLAIAIMLSQSIPLIRAETGQLRATVDCYSDPEVITIVNNSPIPVTIGTVSSRYTPRAEEPFVRNDLLTPNGGSVVYGLGRGSPGIQIGSNLIFHDNPAEGVRIRTDQGFLEVPCTVGTGYLTISPAPAPTPIGTSNGLPPATRPDYALPNGWFYTQASGRPGYGYSVTDQPDARFWREFLRLGGVPGVGYPISRRFLWDGFPSQAFQKMVFQWRPDEGRVDAVNVIDLMHDRGLDKWLLNVRSTPPIANWSSDAGKPWPQVMADHQALLTDPDIRSAYFAAADPITVYGLPMAPIQNLGNVLVLRAQRGIIQKWLIDVPWAKAGQVTVANSGDVAKEAGLLPSDALVPEVP